MVLETHTDEGAVLKTPQPRPGSPLDIPPLVFVHGDMAGAWYWDRYVNYFGKLGWTCHPIDLRGHGDADSLSTQEKARVGIMDYVADVAEAVDHLNDTPIVVGHSSGGLVAAKYLEMYGGAGGVLIAPAPPGGVRFRHTLRSVRDAIAAAAIAPRLVTRGHATITPAEAHRLWFRHKSVDDVQEFADKYDFVSRRTVFQYLRGRIRVDPHKLTMPLLVVAAREDAVIPAQTAWATARYYDAQYVELDDMGHELLNDDGWDRAAGAIQDWLYDTFR